MAKAYAVLFNSTFGERKAIQEFLDTIPEVTFWHSSLPNSVFFTSTLGAREIAAKLREAFPTSDGARFVILEVGADRQGWMPAQTWHLFRNPDNPRLPKKE